MSKQVYIARYLKIINYLKRGQATFEDIENYLERQSEIEGLDFNISQRTLQRDLNEIRTIYSIDIRCNKSSSMYYIADEEELNENQHLLASFDMFNALRLTSNYSELIQFENANVKGSEHIYPLLQAIKSRSQTEITYKKFYEEDSEIVLIEPYLLKQFKTKWYLICKKSPSGDVRTYALDRIQQVDVKRKRFNDKFDVKTYSKNCYGIIHPTDQKVEKITFSFDADQANYIRSFPIHPSQKEIKPVGEEYFFTIDVFITFDLVSELLLYGERITIHSPKHLIREMKGIYASCMKKYSA